MSFHGLVVGLVAFAVIGIFHPIVIKGEYYIGKKIWPAFLIVGLVLIVVSMFLKSLTFSSIVAITGFTCLWSIHEIMEQEKRVEKGWFPRNPKKPTH